MSSTNFERSFDEIFNDRLTDYKNQFPEADISQGSLIYIKTAVLASLEWGLYRHQEWISKQFFPDTSETEYLEHHAWVEGLTRTYGETDAALLIRLLEHIRHPPAGGNASDYVAWALEIDNVAAAYCYPLAQGLGTVDVVVVANATNTGSEVPSSHDTLTGTATSVEELTLIDTSATFITSLAQIGDTVINTTADTEAKIVSIDSETQLTLDTDIFTVTGQAYEIPSLITQVADYIDSERPVTASVVRVLGPTIMTQAVTMAVTGDDADTDQAVLDIAAYMSALVPGQTLYMSQLTAIAIANGAQNATVSAPTTDVTCTDYEMLRPGVISVS